uniref:Ig-like domain-containing protein n=1 Tax=Neolamprologus brichardi TaxID=32507 RepID=A0A3Q4H249_NEOBR
YYCHCYISVTSQSVRTGFIGGEVLLPCVYSEWLSEPVTAFWRDKDDNVVLDIINGKEDKMDPKFRGRVFSFPNHYKTGNLSIIIKGLRADDAGPYDCDIPKVDYQTKMTLKVTGQFSITSTLLGTPQCLCSSSSGVFENLHFTIVLSSFYKYKIYVHLYAADCYTIFLLQHTN